jgi:hypothetical protein
MSKVCSRHASAGFGHALCAFFSLRLIGLLLVCLLIGVSIWLPLFPIISISSASNQRLWSEAIQSGETFIIRYTHSVARSEVDEVLRIHEDQLVIDSTIYESFGAGLPYTSEGNQRFTSTDGKIRIENINLPVRHLDLFVGQVIAKHKLIIHGRTIPLHTISKPGTSIRFSVKKENLWMRIQRRLFHDKSN